MPIRITGLNSGLDTETIISALVSSYNYKTEKYKKAQTKLSWKQDAWSTLNSKIYSLYNSVRDLRFSKAYNLKKTSVSDSTKAAASASSDAVNGTQRLNVLKTAQAGYLTGGKLDSSTTTGTTLAELGYTGGDGKIDLTMGDGSKKTIEVTQGTTVSSFINSLKEAGVNASYDSTNHRLYVSSKETGKDSDFTLTGANVDGANALSKLGLNVESDATKAQYTSYTKYYNADGTQIKSNVIDALNAYQQAQTAYGKATAQNANMTAAYGYANAYSAMQDALTNSGLNDDEQKQLRTLLSMSASGRVNSVMDADGNVYGQKTTDENGNAIFSYTDESGDEKLIQRVVSHTGSDGKSYTLNPNNTYEDADGKVYTATDEKDADGNTIYSHTADDGTETKITVSSETSYYEVTAREENTPWNKITDADGNEYLQNDTGSYTGADGKQYRLSDDQTSLIEIDADGNDVADGTPVAVATQEPITKTVYDQTTGTALTDIKRSADRLTELKEDGSFSLTDEDIASLTNNIAAVNAYENTVDTALEEGDDNTRAKIAEEIHAAYEAGGATAVTSKANEFADRITANKTTMTAAEATMNEHSALAQIAAMEDGTEKDEAIDAFVAQVQAAKDITSTVSYNTDAKKVDGQDAQIRLNGVLYESSKNSFSINGLTVTALSETGDGDENAITITTETDTQGIYDKIKDFLTQYNTLINEITSLYNADSAKGYEPLTDEEREAMSDKEIEKWEEKIKSSLLRRDDTLYGVMNAMTAAMSKGYSVNGKNYYLSTFGIKTLGYLNAPTNQYNAYHIDGDEDDTSTSGNSDKLMAAIMSDPESVTTFMQQLTGGLFDAIGDKMKTTSLSSPWKVYNDKEMASEYSDYTQTIKKWEDKLAEKEDYYYKKFGAMETALGKLQNQTSSLTGLFG